MTVRRTLAALAAIGAAPALLAGLTGLPADAHGAPVNPISRSAACGPEGGQARQSAACKAAVAAGTAVEQWDNIRVAGVDGRDREVIPDGRLCSAGLEKFQGLDLARRDWPATKLSSGADLTFAYRATIGHKGSFLLYLTRNGYDPGRPLTWSALESKPFLTATDPPLVDGAYRMKGKLPAGRTGRQLIYTIWRNSGSADTYYSCSDVVFPAAPAAAAGTPGSRGTAAGSPAAAGPGTPTPGAAATSPAVAGIGSAAPAAVERGWRQGLSLYAAAGVVLAGVAIFLVVGWLRSRRAGRFSPATRRRSHSR